MKNKISQESSKGARRIAARNAVTAGCKEQQGDELSSPQFPDRNVVEEEARRAATRSVVPVDSDESQLDVQPVDGAPEGANAMEEDPEEVSGEVKE